MSSLRLALSVLLLFAVVGCGAVGREAGQAVQPPPPTVKATLEKLASTGELSAVKDQIREELMGFGESNPAKSEELLRDFEQLTSLSDAAAIKAKAKEMADKL